MDGFGMMGQYNVYMRQANIKYIQFFENIIIII